jgi:hypothetical protein
MRGFFADMSRSTALATLFGLDITGGGSGHSCKYLKKILKNSYKNTHTT